MEEWLSLGINKVHGNLSKEKVIGKLQGYSFCGSIRQCFPGSSGVVWFCRVKVLFNCFFWNGPDIILGSEHFLHVLWYHCRDTNCSKESGVWSSLQVGIVESMLLRIPWTDFQIRNWPESLCWFVAPHWKMIYQICQWLNDELYIDRKFQNTIQVSRWN